MAASMASRSRSKRGRPERHLARHRVGRQQHRLVAEPGWLREDRLVAGIEQQPEGDRDGPEGADREGDVRRLERQAELPTHGLGEEGLRLLLARLVGEPVLVLGTAPSRMAATSPARGISCGLPKVKSAMAGSPRRSPYRELK